MKWYFIYYKIKGTLWQYIGKLEEIKEIIAMLNATYVLSKGSIKHFKDSVITCLKRC